MDIDLLSSASFVGGHPVEQYRWLRVNAPVYWHSEPDGPGFWAVTGHDLVREVSKRPEVYSSHVSGTMIYDFPPDELAFFQTMILAMDPPKHSFYRRLVGDLFTPRQVARWRASITETVTEILDGVADRTACDLVADVAGKLPSWVIAELLGIPRDDAVRLYEHTEAMHSAQDAVTDEQRFGSMYAVADYAARIRADKLASPTDDLASRLVAAEVDGRSLTEQEFASFLLLLLNAGGDTARNLVGGAMVTLMARPDRLKRLRTDTATLMPTALEELLRFQSPVIHMRRTAVADTELGGRRIAKPAGEPSWLASNFISGPTTVPVTYSSVSG